MDDEDTVVDFMSYKAEKDAENWISEHIPFGVYQTVICYLSMAGKQQTDYETLVNHWIGVKLSAIWRHRQ